MRRLTSLVFAGAMVAALAGTALAAPTRTASMWACLHSTTLVQTTTNWAGYHPDTLVNVAWETGSTTLYAYPDTRSVQWKYGTSAYDVDLGVWATAAPALSWTSNTNLAVQLYSHGRFLAQTNAVGFGTLQPC